MVKQLVLSALCFGLTLLTGTLPPALAQAAPLPAWLGKMIAERTLPYERIGSVEKGRYDGKTVFEVTQGPPDSSTGHLLFSADGKLICQFGGFVGRVMAGACDFEKIIYGRTLYQSPSR